MERFALGSFQPGHVHAVFGQQIDVALLEVLADHAHEADVA